jgi:uncharacterized protein (TIGR00661 family)
MRVLYGVNGEGMGHATRSQVVIDELLKTHDVRVVASGAAFRYLRERLPRITEVFGPTFAMKEGQIQRWATVRQNFALAPGALPATVKRWMGMVEEWQPEVVVTDFEPLAGLYARATHTPLVCVDNIHMLDRCRHDPEIIGREREDFMLARAVTRAMVPRAGDYVITTFFRPPLAYGRTVLVPPILRPEIVAAQPERGDHLIVYSSGEHELIEALRSSGVPCRIYGMRGGPAEGVVDGNLAYRPRSNEGFVEDLRTARGVVAGGGFSLLSEAVYLGKPVLSVPLQGQFEQVMNARYLQREGFGMCASEVTPVVLAEFLDRLEEFELALAGYEQAGNTVALRTIEERALAAASEDRRTRRRARRAARRRPADEAPPQLHRGPGATEGLRAGAASPLSGADRVRTAMKLFTQDKKVDSLRRAPLFAGLSRKELAQLARLADDVEVPAGTVLCKEGDRGREFFVLMEGKVDVARKGRRVATLGAGDFVGEISLLEPTPRTATVTAKTPLRFFVLTAREFRHLVDENPSVERKVLRALARRVLELSRDPTLA